MYFDVAYKRTSINEGGYANDPDDLGKETYCGISRRFHPEWNGWEFIDLQKKFNTIKNNTIFPELEHLVKNFYKKNFWDVFQGDEIKDEAIVCELYDTSVLMNHLVGVRFLQRSMNVLNNNKYWKDIIVDGVFGKNSLRVFNIIYDKYPNKLPTLYKMLNSLQGARFIQIAEENPKQKKFIMNWFARVGF